MDKEDKIFIDDDQKILDIINFGFPRRNYERADHFNEMENLSIFRRFRLTKPSVLQILELIEEELEYDNDLDIFYYLYYAEDHIVYDYIIVGGGSAGSIIADRLTRDRNSKVLLLEAGRYDPDILHIPSVGLLLQRTPYDWNYETVPQRNACLGLNNNVSTWPMGKIFGGTSMLNNMLYVRGNQKDYDIWFKEKENYNYFDILAYFKKLENHNFQESIGREKSIYVQDLIYTTTLPNVVLKAARSLGYSVLSENLNSNIGFSSPKANLHNGKRCTSADKLKMTKNRNLHIKLNCMVEKIIFESNYEAKGVEYTCYKRKCTARAKKGVILSAGVIGTPKILMLSGIGNRNHLEQLGIKTIVELPVGNNLQDHVTTGFGLILLNSTLELGLHKMFSIFSILEYFINGTGPWTTTGCEVMAFFDTKNASMESNSRPDLQFMVMPLGITEDDGIHLRKLIGISDQVWSEFFSKIKQPTMTILPVLLHPNSKGTVRLASSDPRTKPLIDPQYLTDPEDITTLINGIEILKSLINTDEFKSLGARLNTDVFPGCKHLIFDTKEYWECYIRHLTITSYHPVGTCKMGAVKDLSTVVDFDFQVKGTNKLFVVDGSILPSLPSGNVNAAILMMAEMASNTIKKIDYLRSKECSIYDLFIPRFVC